MSQTIDTPSYTIELSDGSIRPMTVKELAIRLEQLMSADKGIAEMPVGLSVDSEGNGVYVPRVFVPKEAGGRQSDGQCGRCHCRRGLRLLWCSRVRFDRLG